MRNRQWLHRQHKDAFVGMARSEGYRSRAAYKLIELHNRLQLFHQVSHVVDLGAAPGSWSQVAVNLSPCDTKVVALDLLPIQPIPGVHCLQGDLLVSQTRRLLTSTLAGKADLVLSDISPNLSGIQSVDQSASTELVAMVLQLSVHVLKPSGVLVTKIFHGSEFQQMIKWAQERFVCTKIIKPQASRSKSKEVYLYAKKLAS